MIAFIIYLIIGLITGFISFWILYRVIKDRMIKIAKDSKYRSHPTHEDVKKKVIDEQIISVIASVVFWPIVIFVIYPAAGVFIGSCKMYNWLIDRIEGRKFDAAKD